MSLEALDAVDQFVSDGRTGINELTTYVCCLSPELRALFPVNGKTFTEFTPVDIGSKLRSVGILVLG